MSGNRFRGVLSQGTALLLCLLAVLILNRHASAAPIHLPDSGTVSGLKPQALYRPDPDKSLEPGALLASDEGFLPYNPAWEKSAPPLWIKIKLAEPTGHEGDYVLLAKRRFFQRFEIYLPTGDGAHTRINSGAENYEPTDMFGHWFEYRLNLGPDDSGEILIHTKTIQGNLGVLDLQIESLLDFESHRSTSLWAYGLYFGAMLALIFYNFILYLNLRTPGHRLYVTAMASVILLMGMNAGLLQIYLPFFVQERWPLPLLTMHCLVAAATARFFQIFVNSRHFIPKLHRLVNWIIAANLFFFVATLPWPVSKSVTLGLIVQPLGTLTMVALLLASLWSGLRGSRSGFVFLAAWSAFSIGAILWSLLSFDVIDRIPATEYSLYIGSVMEAMILALGLSYRVGQLRTQRNRAMREQQRAARLANVDSLTGAYNRRFLEHYLSGLLDSEDKRAFQGSLIMLDMDNFKPINDEYGHPAGDAVLQEIVRRCEASLRTEDVLARLGGDEFAIVLPDQAGRDAAAVAERIRESISGRPASYGMQPISMAVSIGVVTNFKPGATAYSALKHADRALYDAKRAGRNQVVMISGGEEPSPKPEAFKD